MENDAWSHECIFPGEEYQNDCKLVGHDKSLFILPSVTYDSCLEYNLETKSVALFPNRLPSGECEVLSYAFSHERYIYAIVLDYVENDNSDDESTDEILSKVRLCRFNPTTKNYTLVKDVFYCQQVFAVPMILPRF